ncbi:hypothetical protein IBZ12_01915 [Serratia ureilytica]|uniref:hypothetical protein n=1 Tax=Serratia ureilytica TaxID=300181 RepID=UPI0039B3C089
MSMNVYFDSPPSQDAWIDFTLAVTEVYWLLPDEARPEGIREAGQLFDGMTFETAGLRVSPGAEENIPMKPMPYVEARVGFFQRPDFFHRLVLILIHNLCPGSVRIERDTHTGECGWEQPLIWLRHHLQRPELQAPEAVNERVLTDDSICRHLVQFRDSINTDALAYHWRVIALMDNVWLTPKEEKMS